jgi:hypothetical protein
VAEWLRHRSAKPIIVGSNPTRRSMAIIYIRDVPDDLHKRIRIEAIHSDTTVQKFVMEAVIKELERREQKRASLA